ncbi:glycosyltransferase [Patescibacteria group bacterium]|nr:glycosyltransferase [Patescibacteria group bacterium]
MEQPVVSIVIRALNEAQPLDELLSAIRAQRGIKPDEVEVIVVDNQSTDNTPEVARSHAAQVITLQRDQFSYPKSMNLGVGACHAPIVVLTVGHALPIGPDWLASILPYFRDPKVAGVFGPVLPNKRYGMFEWFMYMQNYWRCRLRNPRYLRRAGTGVFGATNIALRKELWEAHPFDEQYGLGGEDTHWAEWAFQQGYQIVRECGFTVRHSHGLSFLRYLTQIRYWHRLSQPTTFTRKALKYRQDIDWQ